MKYTVKVTGLLVMMLCSIVGLHAQTSKADLLLTANKYYELKLYKKAIVAYKNVLQKDPNLGEVYGKLANSYRLTNDLPNASSWYIRAVQLSSANPEYFFQYGLVLKGLQQYDQAKLYFQEFAKVDAIRGNHFAASCDFAKKNLNAASFYTIMNEAANSAKSDFGASFYGNKVVYASSRNDIKNKSNDKQEGWEEGLFNQLFITTPAANAQLDRPNLLRSGLATRLNEAPVSYTTDGTMVAYTGNNYIDGIRKIPEAGAKLRIYFAQVKSPDHWGKAEPFAYNNPGQYNTAFPTLNGKGTLMYFASDMNGGFGGYDLYYAVKNGNTWSSPVNLAEINTAGDEITPFLSGNVLYFSSNRHYGFGGFDVFRTEKISGAWDRVQHLGKGVNSSYDDYFFAFNGRKNMGYVTSNRPGGKGSDDIYSVRSSAEKIELVVLSAATRQPIVGAKVDFTSCGEGIASTNQNGRFKFLALKGLKCQVTISKAGFEPKTVKISSANKSQRLVEVRLIADQPLRGQYVGTIVDVASQKAVSGVLVTAKNMATQRTLETYTDSKGMYAFDLEPSTTYLVRYSKSSYTTTNKTVDTGDETDRAILGALSFEKSAIIVDNTVEDPIQDTKDVPMTKKIPKIAYEVQIGAFSAPDKAKFNELRKLGYVYSKKKGTYSVYKVGAYRTKTQANAVKQKVIEKGFKDAFVTVLKKSSIIKRVLVGGELDNPIDENPKDKNPIERTPPTKPNTKPVVPKPTTSKGVVFKVQLGAYRNPKFFDRSKVADLGTIDLKPASKGLTLILLGDFYTYQNAKNMVGQVEQRGLPKPIVVAYKDGKKVPLKSVLK